MGAPKIKFTVITATYNAAAVLPRLISSLQAQTDQDFEWVVADGASTDETLALLEEAGKTLNVRVDSRPDFGIYDALNRAVRMAEGDYYLVVGADDEVFPDTIGKYKLACFTSGADLITAKVEAGGKLLGVRRCRWGWLYGQFAYISAHAVGVSIRKNLHEKFGWYSRKFPIAADQFFIQTSIKRGVVVREEEFVAGIFSADGVSGVDVLGALTEMFRVQVALGYNVFFQLLIFFMRLIRHINRLR